MHKTKFYLVKTMSKPVLVTALVTAESAEQALRTVEEGIRPAVVDTPAQGKVKMVKYTEAPEPMLTPEVTRCSAASGALAVRWAAQHETEA